MYDAIEDVVLGFFCMSSTFKDCSTELNRAQEKLNENKNLAQLIQNKEMRLDSLRDSFCDRS